MITLNQALQMMAERGGVPDIGQIPADVARELKRRVRRGELVSWRGYWNTLSPDFGIGPLKTIYGFPLEDDE